MDGTAAAGSPETRPDGQRDGQREGQREGQKRRRRRGGRNRHRERNQEQPSKALGAKFWWIAGGLTLLAAALGVSLIG